jgi:hypothetical protein
MIYFQQSLLRSEFKNNIKLLQLDLNIYVPDESDGNVPGHSVIHKEIISKSGSFISI